MKKISLIFALLCALFSPPLLSDTGKTSPDEQVSSANVQSEFALKAHHQKLQLPCTACHKEQDPAQYKPLATKECLTCHGSAEKVAKRTGFMDTNQTNPHRSLHDGLDLDCYECHAEHKPSTNLCETCHDNTRDWFGPTP